MSLRNPRHAIETHAMSSDAGVAKQRRAGRGLCAAHGGRQVAVVGVRAGRPAPRLRGSRPRRRRPQPPPCPRHHPLQAEGAVGSRFSPQRVWRLEKGAVDV
eukprot:3464276-Rhodomonas_salina.1